MVITTYKNRKERESTITTNFTISGLSWGSSWDVWGKHEKPERVIFNGLTTILFWKDGSKNMVRCGDVDLYDREVAVAMGIAHKTFGSKAQFKKFVESGYEAMSVGEEIVRKMIRDQKRLGSVSSEDDNDDVLPFSP